ncbi:MAG: VapC toxin family PIN domain ribonuclease, partial [Chloroflexota bacterium]|nr:VapC toxin family PIN domain ribonuclease [Chloroflexota bacterium]
IGLERQFESRILPVDFETGRLWGELTARAQQQGFQIPATGGIIAATGIRHGLHVMTRNTLHFAATGALIVNPWSE